MLATVANDNVGCQDAHVVSTSIASMLAPTGLQGYNSLYSRSIFIK